MKKASHQHMANLRRLHVPVRTFFVSLRNLGQLLLFVCTLLSLTGSASAQSQLKLSPQARAYLQVALDLMQKNALRKKQVDWNSLRRETFKRAAGAEQPIDTYEAIRFALASLGDHHSHLSLTPELEQAEKERLRVRAGSQSQAGAGNDSLASYSPYVGRYEPEGHLHHFSG